MGNVYFVAADGAIKIGYSTDVSKRMAQLQTGAACKLRLLAIFPGVTVAIEKRLHDEFKNHRLEGEWFRYHRTIVRFAAAISAGSRPQSAVEIHALAVIVRDSRDTPQASSMADAEKEAIRRRKIMNRKPAKMPFKFIGTAQENLILELDAMTRNPDLANAVYGAVHGALRAALTGKGVDLAELLTKVSRRDSLSANDS